MNKRSGYVAILGRPNVGKSTLLNYLVGAKLAGISAKPQTTRDSIKGILTTSKGQVIFIDTPGVHKPHDLLGKKMMRGAEDSSRDADIVFLMVTPKPIGRQEEQILSWLEKKKQKAFLLINQVDRYSKESVLPVLAQYQQRYDFEEFIPISAKEGIQLPLLLEKTYEHLPENEPFFPDDQISDETERFHVQEIIREKLFQKLGQEIPYATAVVINTFDESSQDKVQIDATIVIEKESQKVILIGKNGEKIKQIGIEARKDIEEFLDRKVNLKLWAKTRAKWKDNRDLLREYGY